MGDRAEEQRVIEQIENPAAKSAGESTRKNHGGTDYATPRSTSTVPFIGPILPKK